MPAIFFYFLQAVSAGPSAKSVAFIGALSLSFVLVIPAHFQSWKDQIRGFELRKEYDLPTLREVCRLSGGGIVPYIGTEEMTDLLEWQLNVLDVFMEAYGDGSKVELRSADELLPNVDREPVILVSPERARDHELIQELELAGFRLFRSFWVGVRVYRIARCG